MRLFPDHGAFAPGVVKWDNLDQLDPALPLYEQESLVGCEDVLAVWYPNDVFLDVSFVSRMDQTAHFVVAVVPRGEEWQPAVERSCGTFEELKRAVLELAPVARDWKC